MKQLAVALAFLPLLAAAPAFAQAVDTIPTTPAPAPAPPAPPAPQTNNWADVSHINGQLVKVGERDDYLFQNKKTNLSVNPIGWLFGFYGASASYAVTNNIAIKADGDIYNIDSGNTTGYEAGISAPIYLKRVYRGPFVEPGVVVRSLTDNYGCDSIDANGACVGGSNTDTLVGPEVMVGWHFSFDSGLNAAIAFGAAKNVVGQGGEVQPQGYLRIGYEF